MPWTNISGKYDKSKAEGFAQIKQAVQLLMESKTSWIISLPSMKYAEDIMSDMGGHNFSQSDASRILTHLDWNSLAVKKTICGISEHIFPIAEVQVGIDGSPVIYIRLWSSFPAMAIKMKRFAKHVEETFKCFGGDEELAPNEISSTFDKGAMVIRLWWD